MIGVLSTLLLAEKDYGTEHLIGSQVAGREFVKNMLRYVPAPVQLFVSRTHLEPSRKEMTRLGENEDKDYSAHGVCSYEGLPRMLREKPVTAFYNIEGPWLHKLAYLRSKFAQSPFPITGSIHGFSYQTVLWDIFTRLLLTPTLPCDSILCTSEIAKEAFQRNLYMVQESLAQAGITQIKNDVRLDVVPLG